MCSAVFVLSLLVAMDPVRIGIMALLISRPRPMLNLLAFWLGGMAAGISVALVVLLFLRDFTLSVMREVVSAISSPIVAHIQVAIGVLAVLIAARFWARQRAPVPVTGGEASVSVLEPNTATGSGRLSIRGQLEGGSLVVAFVAGLALATPPVEYLAAIIAILASGATAAAASRRGPHVHPRGVYGRRGPAHQLSRNAGEDASRRAATERLDKRAPPAPSPPSSSAHSVSYSWLPAWARSDG